MTSAPRAGASIDRTIVCQLHSCAATDVIVSRSPAMGPRVMRIHGGNRQVELAPVQQIQQIRRTAGPQREAYVRCNAAHSAVIGPARTAAA
jgi:hypothetical protein